MQDILRRGTHSVYGKVDYQCWSPDLNGGEVLGDAKGALQCWILYSGATACQINWKLHIARTHMCFPGESSVRVLLERFVIVIIWRLRIERMPIKVFEDSECEDSLRKVQRWRKKLMSDKLQGFVLPAIKRITLTVENLAVVSSVCMYHNKIIGAVLVVGTTMTLMTEE